MSFFDGVIAVLVFILILLLTNAPTNVLLVKGRSIHVIEWILLKIIQKQSQIVSETFIIHFIEVSFRNLFTILQVQYWAKKNSPFDLN